MLEDLKNYLNITWEDEDIDKKLNNLIEESERSLNAIFGVDIDYSDNLEARELLFNRIRYAYNNALEYFETNFSKEILRISLLEGVNSLEN